jgi:hypothetical protein
MIRRGLPLAAVAVVVLALVVIAASGDPSRTPSIASSAAAPSLPLGTSASPQIASPTTQPSRPGSWTELRWSAPARIPGLLDVVSWQNGYVAGADVAGPEGHVGAAYISEDALRWERTATFPARPSIFATSTGLLAVINRSGPPPSVETWTSNDGRGWKPQGGLAFAGAAITSLASRGSSLIAAGVEADGRSIVLSSDNGAPWTRVQPLAPRAIVRAVVGVSDGFVALGRDGEPDAGSGGVGSPGVGRPAAWTSPDGRVWSAARVEGTPAPGAQLAGLFKVSDGLFAIGSDSSASGQNPRSPLIWASADGRDWRIVGPPEHWGRAGANGRQAIVFYYADFGTTALGAWSSLDGRIWNRVSFSGDVANIPGFTVGLGQDSGIDGILVVPRGVVVIGQQNGQPTAWFAEAIGP